MTATSPQRSPTTSRDRPTTGTSGPARSVMPAPTAGPDPSGPARRRAQRLPQGLPRVQLRSARRLSRARPTRSPSPGRTTALTNAATTRSAYGGTRAPYQTARSYRLQVAQSATITDQNAIDDQTVDQATYTAYLKTYPEGDLWWRVQAIDGRQPARLVGDPQAGQGDPATNLDPSTSAHVERPRSTPARRRRSTATRRRAPRCSSGRPRTSTSTWEHRGLQERRHHAVHCQPRPGHAGEAGRVRPAVPAAAIGELLPLAGPSHRRRRPGRGAGRTWAGSSSTACDHPDLPCGGRGDRAERGATSPGPPTRPTAPRRRSTDRRSSRPGWREPRQRRRPSRPPARSRATWSRAPTRGRCAPTTRRTSSWAAARSVGSASTPGSGPRRPAMQAPAGSAVGQTLTSTPPVWNQPDVTTTYQWLRNGAEIGDADRPTYVLTTADYSKDISLRVTGRQARLRRGHRDQQQDRRDRRWGAPGHGAARHHRPAPPSGSVSVSNGSW